MRLRRPPASGPAAAAVLRSASRLHARLDGRHTVCSPLGAWLLVALLAPSVDDGAADGALGDVLGVDPATADALARDLLAHAHPAVAAAVALWARDPAPPLAAFGATLAGVAEVGPLPTQHDADAWARNRTDGLVDRFPLELGPTTAAVLASALATRVSWASPFGTARSTDLSSDPDPAFAGATWLRSPNDHWHGIVDGRFAAHCAEAREGLVVTSVIGAPDDPPALLLDTAARVASGRATGDVDGVTPVADLPLGAGPAWTVSEETATGAREQWRVLVPAWSAAATHDLTSADDLGVPAALAALGRLADAHGPGEAVQTAVASYTREGFEAAAVTALGVRYAAVLAEHRVRTVRVDYCRPYAVVAAVSGDGAWRGVPVFSAWVAQPAG